MIHMGDEYGHTKRGNNNTYCHDSDLSWFDWDTCNADEDGLRRFVKQLIKLRKTVPQLRAREYLGGDRLQWHGEHPDRPDWSPGSRFLAFTVSGGAENPGGVYCAFNTSHYPKIAELPHWHGFAWRPLADTAKPPPLDFLLPDDMLSAEEASYVAAA